MRCPNKPDMAVPRERKNKKRKENEERKRNVKTRLKAREASFETTHANGRIGQFDGTKERIQGLCPSR